MVTGATRGIGRAIAEALATAGADVVISARTSSDLKRVAAELDADSSGRVVGIAADVSRTEDCSRLVQETADAFGRLDVLVNNAGVGILASIEELSVEDWETQIHTNLRGVFCCSKAAVPHLKSTEGWIINIGSLAGRNPFAGGSGYNASKFGLVGMTEAMMLDVRHSGVRVSMVMPGSVDTRFGGDYPEGGRAWALGAEDVASAVLHLLSYPDNAHVSRVEMRPSRPPKK
jgi:3-oxoacyl-[acyl-carrier protein] reductase